MQEDWERTAFNCGRAIVLDENDLGSSIDISTNRVTPVRTTQVGFFKRGGLENVQALIRSSGPGLATFAVNRT